MTLMLLLHLISNHQHFMIEIYASLLWFGTRWLVPTMGVGMAEQMRWWL
jgi:hypothetical protein